MNRLQRRQAFLSACVGFSLLAAGCSDSGVSPSATARQRVPLTTSGSDSPAGVIVDEGESLSGKEPSRLGGVNWSDPSLLPIPKQSQLVSASGDEEDIGPISEEEARQMEAEGRIPHAVDSPNIPPRNRPLGKMPLSLQQSEPAKGEAKSQAPVPATSDGANQGSASPSGGSRYSLEGEKELSLNGPIPLEETAHSGQVVALPAPDEPVVENDGLPSWQESRKNNYQVEGMPPTSELVSLPQADAPVDELPMSHEAANSFGAGRVQPSKASIAALSEQCGSLLGHARSLAQRGALYSARADVVQSERLITQAMDAMAGSAEHSQAMSAANIAMEEADDFLLRAGDATGEINVQQIADAHRTPILRDGRGVGMSPLAALQAYYAYAQKQLLKASGGLPIASEAFYWHGKICSTLVDGASGNTTSHNARAMVFHQAALEVNPNHYLAANELGVLMARFGQLEEAKKMLVHSVRVQPHVDGWHNLAVVHSRLGEAELAKQAEYERSLAQKAINAGRGNRDSIQVVDASTFARQNSAGSMPMSSQPAANARTATSPTTNSTRR